MEISTRKALSPANFSVSARVAMQLGRESISSSITAVLELVKNSYDADAEKVSLSFNMLGSDAATLVIEDDGIGMSLEDLIHKWMVLGTSNKQGQPVSFGKARAMTGEKGLGRLGLDRLSSSSTVRTKKVNSSSSYELDIEWNKYENTAAKLESIAHPVYEIVEESSLQISGTRISLRGLKDRWSVDELSALRRELSLLLSPFSGSQDFQITLNVAENPSLSGAIQPPMDLLEAAKWKVGATVDEKGLVEFGMSSAHHSDVMEHGPIHWVSLIKGMGKTPLFGPLHVLLYFFPRESVKARNEFFSRSRVVSFLNENQGVRIYRDGFRVKPYGQPNGEGDWLTLANRRVQNPQGVRQKGLWHVGPNQLVGGVFISRSKNSLLDDQTNREGLLEGDAFAQLRVFMLTLISWFERTHQKYERDNSPPVEILTIESAAAASETASAAAGASIKKLRDEISAAAETPARDKAAFATKFNRLLNEVQAQINSSVLEAARTVQTAKAVQAEADRQKDALANLASLGILAASFGHETVNWSGNLVKNAIQLDRDFNSIVPDARSGVFADTLRRFSDLKADADRIRKFAKFTLGNILREKRSKSYFSPKGVAEYVFESFREILSEDRKISYSIKSSLSSDDGIFAFEADWECIFSNLITNSVWALRESLAHERKIELDFYLDGSEVCVEFLDSGHGMEAGTEQAVFEPTFTTKRNRSGEPTGTGLGLSIVKSFVVENTGGKISAVSHGRLGGATIIMRLPRISLGKR